MDRQMYLEMTKTIRHEAAMTRILKAREEKTPLDRSPLTAEELAAARRLMGKE